LKILKILEHNPKKIFLEIVMYFELLFQKPAESHYVEEKATTSEQKQWEEEHLHSAIMKFGARDAKAKNKVRKNV
jgi:hypothetical protein